MLIGYAGVSIADQNLDRQIAAQRDAGCETIFREKATAKKLKDRPELAKAIDRLVTADVLVVAEWYRATRSMMDGIQLMQRIADRGSAIKVLDKPHLDLTSKMGQGLLALLSAMAEDERERIVKRANEGRAVAKRAGRKMGRPSALSEHQIGRARERLAAGEICRAIALDKGVSKSTISRLQRGQGS